ncbi:MAG: hypothetical protein DRH23_07620 [Deltaproteobacteria bacterium]|nr:MAG: hypothetical protein DRH23_07620 [Deltaproteobacteria bacterium]
MSRRVAWLAAALVLSSCHRHAKPETSPPATSIETTPSSGSRPGRAASPATGVAGPATAKERAAIDDLVRAAASVRQLKLRRPVTIEIEDGDAIANSLRSQIEDAEIERARLVYGALGLLDVDADLHSLFAGVLGEQVIGYYDPDTGRLVIREDVMAGLAGAFGPEQTQEARLVLVHELVHALQDQRLGLGESYQKERTADEDNAFRAVVEGDATLAMLAHALRQQGIPLSAATDGIQQMGDYVDLNALVRGEKLDAAPAILRVTLVAPGLRGLQFVAALQGRGGWPAVNNAHRRPPATTEQVLHPEKYFAREPGEQIEIPDNGAVLAAGFKRVEGDTLGELELAVYLGQGRPSGTDDEAAAGWAGDRLAVYSRRSEVAVIWWTTWDDDAEAVQAYRAARSVSPKNSKARVERKGRSVLIVRGLPAKLHRSVRGDFTSFARYIKAEPAPPDVRRNLVY